MSINNDGIHAMNYINSNPIHLNLGKYRFELDYFQGPRMHIGLQLFWSLNSAPFSIIPAENFVFSLQTELVFIEGGVLPAQSPLSGESVNAFQINKYETSWGEWKIVRDWAIRNGYDIGSVGNALDDGHGVSGVSWYDVVKWCNAKSQMEGLLPVYTNLSGGVYKSGKIEPLINLLARGYRLPTEKEWEWASRGGIYTKHYKYSGSDNYTEVAWVNFNSDLSQKSIALKNPNELGIYDMSGNIYEWCSDYGDISFVRSVRGGSFFTTPQYADNSTRLYLKSGIKYQDVGFRYARNIDL
jgi:formylglycine-generating enzyme required for sulfatase activity